jgi:hypothetical protein
MVLSPVNRDELRAAVRSAKPFPNVCLDSFLQEPFAREIAASFPSYNEATRIGRSFKAVNERGKVQVTDAAKFAGPIARLNAELASPEFVELLSDLFGIPKLLADGDLVGGGMHQTGPRGHLDVHVDFNYIEERQLFRRLNLLLYFNEGWREEWGGELELWDAQVKVRHHLVPPAFNRCLIFETSEISFHGVRAVTCPEGTSRRSFAAYYYTREPPPGWTGRNHTTIFQARPDETLKRVLYMPAERAARRVSGLMRGAKDALKRLRSD